MRSMQEQLGVLGTISAFVYRHMKTKNWVTQKKKPNERKKEKKKKTASVFVCDISWRISPLYK